MKWMRWASLAMVSGMTLASGCRKPVPPPAGPTYPPAVQLAPDSREQIQRLAPDALIGTVVAIIPESRLAAVADVPLAQIKVGDAMTFMGGEPAPIGVGVVTAIVNGRLHVQYGETAGGGRPPVVGDLAVRFKK